MRRHDPGVMASRRELRDRQTTADVAQVRLGSRAAQRTPCMHQVAQFRKARLAVLAAGRQCEQLRQRGQHGDAGLLVGQPRAVVVPEADRALAQVVADTGEVAEFGDRTRLTILIACRPALGPLHQCANPAVRCEVREGAEQCTPGTGVQAAGDQRERRVQRVRASVSEVVGVVEWTFAV